MTRMDIKEKPPEQAAKEKLRRIIQREGDENGIRRTPEYFALLIAEEIEFRRNRKPVAPR